MYFLYVHIYIYIYLFIFILKSIFIYTYKRSGISTVNSTSRLRSFTFLKIKLLEFGMGYGGSVDMWQEYFRGDEDGAERDAKKGEAGNGRRYSEVL